MGMQCTLKALGLYVWADALWWRWDAIVPRQFAWREVARDGEARQRLVKPGDMVVLHRVH
jgi:hypothetical protein